jgi:hypothetical protein
VLKRHYPDFYRLLESIPDHRARRSYKIAEIIMGGLSMFIFKCGSRNNTDKFITNRVEKNFITIFGLRLPVMDTVDVFLRELPACELEKLKQLLVRQLIEKRALDKFRYCGRFIVAVDGTGIYSFDYEPFAGCPHKTSKNGKTTWQVYVLEAKIVCSNNFSISLATEWLQNSDNMDEKQDCEQKAFVRLACKLKKMYPRMAVAIAADALYPNNTFFDICKKNGWRFILTFKEGTLKTVWEEVMLLYLLQEKQNKQTRIKKCKKGKGREVETSMFINGIEYKKHRLNWVEYTSYCTGENTSQQRFVHITDLDVNRQTVWETSFYGRLRWKIENEGFNTQKNGGYNLQHKYSRKHTGAMQNYYQLLQIAHLIVQLTERLKAVQEGLKLSDRTAISLWTDLWATMLKEKIETGEVCEIVENTKQLRY